MSYKNTIFALDVSATAIGWSVLQGRLNLNEQVIPERFIDGGVRVFPTGRDPKSGDSLAVARREARSARRMRDRFLQRKKHLLNHLIKFGFFSQDPAERKRRLREAQSSKERPFGDIWNLRARALTEQLPLYHIGNVLYHLNMRRGFKSNRKTDNKDNEKGKIAMGIEELRAQLQLTNSPTIGVYLAKRHNEGRVVRLRQDSEAYIGEKQDNYLFYPERSMLEDEFNQIWAAQKEFYPEIMTGKARRVLFKIIFHQRPLKEQKVGRCAFNPDEERLPKAHPLFQEFRLYKELNELTIELAENVNGRKLTLEQRDTLAAILRAQKKMAFSAIRKQLGLKGTTFKKEKNAREGLIGDEVFAEMVNQSRFGQAWGDFSRERQWEIINQLREEPNPEKLDRWLAGQFPELDEEQRQAIADTKLPEGYGRLGYTALSNMLEELKAEVIPEAEAAARVGYDHALLGGDREALDRLPKYQAVPNVARSIPPGEGGRAVPENDPDYDKIMGRITNPTVHVALNQLRLVVNGLIDKYGKPQDIAVKIDRDLSLSEKEKITANKSIKENTQAALARNARLAELGIKESGYNRQLIRFWEELNEDINERRCPYSGELITLKRLFSADVLIAHILPYSRTLDNSNANKTVCLKSWNDQKRGLAPAEAADLIEGWDYPAMLARAQYLPQAKRWRFTQNAMTQFEKEESWIARQLEDTKYLSRLVRAYLSCLYPGREENSAGEMRMRYHIRTISGRLTETFRSIWELNTLLPDATEINDPERPKNRLDYRHRAIDAAVSGITTREQLATIALAAKYSEKRALDNYIKRAFTESLPWADFRTDLQRMLERVIVSHKSEHGTLPTGKDRKEGKDKTVAKLMKETAYGLPVDEKGERLRDEKGNEQVIWRVPLRSLTAKDIAKIRDPYLANELSAHIYTETGALKDGKEFTAALLSFPTVNKPYQGIRHCRMIDVRNTIPVYDKNGRAYKGYWNDGNYRYDIWQTLDGNWHYEVITMYDAHKPGYKSAFHATHPTAKRIMNLHQNDMVAYHDLELDKRVIARVVKFSANGAIVFAPHNEAFVDRRNRDKVDPFKYFTKTANTLRPLRFRKIRVDAIGRVTDRLAAPLFRDILKVKP